jgi:hypothetical protein
MAVVSASLQAATQGGAIPVPLPLFPQNNWWNVDISAAPVDTNSASYIAVIGGAAQNAHPDFGGDDPDVVNGVFGFPFIKVDGAQTKLQVYFDPDNGSPDESDGDGIPFYPVPAEAITTMGWVEGGQPGNVDVRADGDRHILIVDTTNNHLYELYSAWYNGTNWEALSGAFFDMNTNNRRTEGWTSADASGMAILPGLVRYDEVFGPDEIRHALRVTVNATNGYVYPASHVAGSTAGALPMGARLRMKASKDLSGYTSEVQKIFRAFKKYGLIVADNGSNLYVSGVYDTNWDNGVLNPAFASLTANDFEVVELGWKPTRNVVLTLPQMVSANDPTTATLTVYDQNYQVATGYTGTVQFTSTDGAATLPTNYTFTGADAGTHTFTGGFTLRTPGFQIVTFKDTVTATNTGSAGSAVGPGTPVITATATGLTSVGVSWTAPSGATSYELLRTPAFAGTVTTALTTYTDNSAVANSTYVYRVQAIDASSNRSPLSAPDVATTVVFADEPLVAGTTIVKKNHIDQLRTAINAMRTRGGLVALAGLTDPTITAQVTLVKAAHITQLRTGLDQARAALGLGALSYTDAVPTIVKAVHVQQLRNGVK